MTNNKLSERENKETIPFTIAAKRIKHLGMTIAKKVKGPHSLMTDIQDDTNKWKDTLCSWIGRINIAKMTQVLILILPKAIYRFNVRPIKTPIVFSIEF